MLLFAPGALIGEQADGARKATVTTRKPPAADVIPTLLTDTLKAMSIAAPGGAYGYLRIYGFDTGPDEFIDELLRLMPLLPDRGLILDLRGNPGGYIWAAELALQLFTPKPHRTDPLLGARHAVHPRHGGGLRHSATSCGPGRRRSRPPCATASCTRSRFRSRTRTSATRSDSTTAAPSCSSATRPPTRPAISSRPGSSTTRSARSSASARPPAPEVPTSGTTPKCARRSQAHRSRCRPSPTGSGSRSRFAERHAPARARACRSRTSASPALRTR